MSATNAGTSSADGSWHPATGDTVAAGWDGIDIEEYSRKYARALRHAPRNTRSQRPGIGLGATGATVTTGILAAVFMVPGAAADTPSTEAAPQGGAGKVAGSFGAEDSWAEFEAGEVLAHEDLDKQPGAASRAKYRVPIEVSACLPTEAANGARQMVRQQAVYMPLQEGTFSFASPYGYRIHPTLGIAKLHEGVDLSAPLGTPIYAPADGVVITVASGASEGDYVVIEHTLSDGSVFHTYYLHQYMDQIPVSEGQEVTAGNVIGHVGNSGRSTGPHLHFEVRDPEGNTLDPMAWLESNGAVYIGQGC